MKNEQILAQLVARGLQYPVGQSQMLAAISWIRSMLTSASTTRQDSVASAGESEPTDERAAFEAWARSQGTPSGGWWLRVLPDGGYSSHDPDVAWKGWQARAALAAASPAAPPSAALSEAQERADAEGSRAVMLARQRRKLQDTARETLKHMEFVTNHLAERRQTTDSDFRAAVGQAYALVLAMTEKLPNTPEVAAPTGDQQ